MTKAIHLNTSFNLKQSKYFTDTLLVECSVEIDLTENINVMKLLSALKAENARVEFVE